MILLSFRTLLVALIAAAIITPAAAQERPRFEIEAPAVVLSGVPVERVAISAVRADGSLDADYHERPDIHGVRLVVRGEEAEPPPFQNGRLILQTDLAADEKVYVTAGRIVVDPAGPQPGVQRVNRIPGWLSLAPPLLAIGLAVWLRNVIVALFAGVFGGAVILARGDPLTGFVRTLDTYIPGQIVESAEHVMIVLFTLFLGAMVGVMAGSGGTRALVHSLARFTQKREHGQMMTWALGFLIFFDDYANTMLVGSTMRPVADRLRLSREKLAFLVDSTAAPIAGLALISTWVGVEVGYIVDSYQQIYAGTGQAWDGYTVFLATLPYRFYPLLLIVFVFLIAWTGRDYGPMLRAERRALGLDEPTSAAATASSVGRISNPSVPPDAEPAPEATAPHADEEPSRLPLLRNVLVPLVVLVVLILLGLWWTGRDGLAAVNELRRQAGEPPLPVTFWAILQESDSTRVLLLASFAASAAAAGTAVCSRSLSLQQATEAWLGGAKGMFVAVVILVLAWAVAALCDSGHLNTAGFLVEQTRGWMAANWMPAVAFLLAGVVAFATGSSWATMGLLMPLFISATHYLLVDLTQAAPHHPLMLATIGAILGGAIFGDHCSPISDTTVLSSAASGCDHLDHVLTQFPYALSVGLIALLLGYVPIGLGFRNVWLLLPLGLAATYLTVRLLGRRPGETGERGA